MSNNILIISPDRVSNAMAGPGIRYWNFSKELSKHFKVKLLVPNEDYIETSGFEVIFVKNENEVKRLLHSEEYKAILVQGLALVKYPFLKYSNIPLIIDIYDPFILENLELERYNSSNSLIEYQHSLDILNEQLLHGDYFICASERQKDFWIGMLAALMRINPIIYKEAKKGENLIGVVPFGIENTPATHKKKVIKGVIPGINPNDKVIIWGGGLWDWLDPITLIKAMEVISNQRSDIKCIILGTKHPDPSFIPHEIVKKTTTLSDNLGLTNNSVFFIEWINYGERENYYLESDIGVSLHYDNLETKYSFRTRILDYIWCKLPMIATKGDTFADIVDEFNLGKTVEPENVDVLVEAIKELVKNEKEEMLNNFNLVSKKYTWDNVVKDLVKFCQHPTIKHEKQKIIQLTNKKKANKLIVNMRKVVNLVKQGEFKVLKSKIKERLFS